ncbi:MAG: cobaltochelatase CobN, partial [Methanothermobacter sp.]|nr:cobaltochelatase CobN [Methanothermobacter sp.]
MGRQCFMVFKWILKNSKEVKKIMRKHLITVTAVLLMLMFCQSVAAADNSTED